MTSRVLVTIGAGQCVNWGVLYYAFASLLSPVQRDLGVEQWLVAGAFSVALLASALAAPAVGVRLDRGEGPRLMRAGGYAAAALLGVWATVPTLGVTYLVWAGLGACMSATLYEPAFAFIGRALDRPAERLRALSTMTVLGGLASTIFLPLTAALTTAWGWRPAVAVLAGITALSTFISSRVMCREHVERGSTLVSVPAVRQPQVERDPLFLSMQILFSAASLASAAFTTTAVVAFVARGLPPGEAALFAGLIGVMQLPGRAVLMTGAVSRPPSQLLIFSLALQAAGLLAVAAGPRPLIAIGVAAFALGSGVITLIRPQLVYDTFGIARAGHVNGRLTRSQQLARAAGPIAATGLAAITSYRTVFTVLALVFAALAIGWRARVSLPQPSSFQEVT